jgi:hypothetical protein
VLPSLTTAEDFLQDPSDRTWNAVIPMIWLQISLNMSLFTACIPSLSGVIDSILVSATYGAIQAPYQLTRARAGAGVHATAIPLPQLDSSRYFQRPKRQLRSLNISSILEGVQETGISHNPEIARKPAGDGEAVGSACLSLSSLRVSHQRELKSPKTFYKFGRHT